MGESTLTGTEFARVTKSYSSYSLSWIGSYSLLSQDAINNTSTIRLYGSMYTNSGSNVRSSNSTDVEQVNGVTLSPPTPAAYRYSSNQTYGFSVNSGYSLFGYTDITVTHNANGTFPTQTIGIYSKNYHHASLSTTGDISGIATIDRSAPTLSASAGNQGMTSCTLSASSGSYCNLWEYKIGSGSWVTFSTTNATSASVTVTGLTAGTTYTFTVRARKTYNYVQNTATASVTTIVSTPATVTASTTNTSATAVTLSASTNVDCNKWEYSINSGAYTTFSTTNGTSASTTISNISSGTTATVTVRVTRTLNGVTSTGTTSYDKTASTVSASTSSVTSSSFTLSASSGVNCNKWEYQLNSGSWVTFSTTNGTSASVSITGLSPNTSYTVNVRVTKTANYVTSTTSTSAKTLGASSITSVANCNVDNTTTVTFTPLSTTFYYSIQIKWGSTTYKNENIGRPNTTSAYTYTTVYTFPASVLANTTSATWTMNLHTWADSGYSTLVGSASKTFTVSVPNTATYQPSGTLTFTPYNTNTWINSKGLYVSGYSQINIAVSPSAGSGASVSSVVVGSPTATTVSTNNFRTGVINSTSQSVSVTITDSRSRTKTVTGSVSLFSYSSPSVSQFSTERGTYSNGTWTANVNGSHIRATVVAACSLSANGNTVTKTVTCGGNTATAISGNYYYWTNTTAETSYTVNVSATDSVGVTTTFASQVSAIAVPFNLNTGLPAAAFGKVAETAKSLELASDWRLTANGKSNTFAYMPSSWLTYGGNSSTNGYARIATVKVTHYWASGPIEFVVKRYGDSAETRLYLVFESTGGTTDPSVRSFTFDINPPLYSTDAGGFSAFVYKTTTSTWDVYVYKSYAGAEIDVSTYVPLPFANRIDITYADSLLTSVPNGAVMATQLPIKNIAKNNVMTFMPYTFVATGGSSSTGYARIASIQITQNWCYGTITFDVRRITDRLPITLHLYFSSEASTTPVSIQLVYEGGEGVNPTYPFDAFIYSPSASVLDVYVKKVSQGDEITVTSYMPEFKQQRCIFTYSNALLTSVPSGAIMAKQLGALQYQYNIFNNTQSLVFSIANGVTRKLSGITTGECAWILSCTGWAQNIRSGLWYIAGYNDSSRADVTTLKTASAISISAVSGELAWNITNTGGQNALFTCTVLYGAMPTIT